MRHFAFGLFFTIAIGFFSVNAQIKNELSKNSIAEKFHLYSLKKNKSILFAHFDKTVYTNNELVWFTAYLLNNIVKNDDFINVILVNDASRTIALQKKFVCKSGFAFGKIQLPDTLSAGKYSFILYNSNVRGNTPEFVFTQPIVIKTTLLSSTKPTFQLRPLKFNEQKTSLNVDNQVNKKPDLSLKNITAALAETIVDDTLCMQIKSKQPSSASMLVHNYRELFFIIPFKINSSGKTFKIALTDLPKGVAEVSVLDSLQNPVVQKLFFAHYNQRNYLQIITDNRSYKPHEKVTLKLKLNELKGSVKTGNVSIACIQANRQTLDNKRDIESYVYLNTELAEISTEKTISSSQLNRKSLGKTLSTANWRNYNWNDLQNTTFADTVLNNHTLPFTGNITHRNKLIKKPVSVFLIKDSTTIIQTDLNGKFTLTYNDLLTTENKKIHFLVSGSYPTEYKITIDDPYESINKTLVKNDEMFQKTLQSAAINEIDSSYYFKGFDHLISLKEVQILSRKDNSFYQTKKINSCGDYVCKYGFLNCPQHGGDAQNVAAINGKTYKNFDGISADGLELSHLVYYQNCNPQKNNLNTSIDCIKTSGSFYPVNFEQENPSEPKYISTIYWNHLYKISLTGKLPIQFYTGDITGNFKIIVQGIAGNDVVYSETEITVTGK